MKKVRYVSYSFIPTTRAFEKKAYAWATEAAKFDIANENFKEIGAKTPFSNTSSKVTYSLLQILFLLLDLDLSTTTDLSCIRYAIGLLMFCSLRDKKIKFIRSPTKQCNWSKQKERNLLPFWYAKKIICDILVNGANVTLWRKRL